MQRASLESSPVSQGSEQVWGYVSSLVATGVDGADILEAEVPFQAGLNKGRHKAAAGSIHMDLHIVPLAAQTRGMSYPCQLVCLTLSGILLWLLGVFSLLIEKTRTT